MVNFKTFLKRFFWRETFTSFGMILMLAWVSLPSMYPDALWMPYATGTIMFVGIMRVLMWGDKYYYEE